MFLVFERWAGDGDRLLYWPQVLFRPQQHFFLILAGLLNRLQAGSHAGILSPTDSNRPHLVILLFNALLLPLFFRLFTQVHLLIDGSVEGQYIT